MRRIGVMPGQAPGEQTALDLLRDLFVANTVFVLAACLVLLWASWHCYQRHRLPFLRVWLFGWLCYFAARLLTWLQLGPWRTPDVPAAVGMALSVVSQVGYYLHVVCVLVALLRLTQVRSFDVSVRIRSLLLVGLVAFATAVTCVTQDAPELRAPLRVGMRCAVTSIVFALCGGMLLVVGRRMLRVGPRVTAFALWSGAIVFGCYAYSFTFGSVYGVSAWVGAAEVLFVGMLGLGLVVWTQEDLTHEARFVGEELGRRNLELARAQRIESLGQVAGSIAHDFHNLLTVVTGNLDHVLRGDVDPSTRAALADAARAAQQAGKLTGRLLSMARQGVLPPRRLDLNAEVAELVALLRSLSGRDVELRAECVSGTLPVMLPPGQVEQILINLVTNARDAIAGNGVVTLATFRSNADGERRVGCAVSDTGVGMSEQVRARVGDLFFTTKGERGTGIGMATVRSLLEASGGRLQIESRPGSGTTVRLSWPESVAAEVPPPPPAEANGRVVLVAEDDVATRRMVRSLLERNGYTVLAPEDSQAAAAVLQDAGTRVDLLLTDVVMPGLSGPQLVQLANERRPRLAVRYMSGSVQVGSAGRLDGVPLLQKPFMAEQLLAFVAAALAADPRRSP
ncbi:MAG: response regulator [Planctomycetes bacterium]|nr:response regulator [Planctomycetota bacterium]